MNLPETGEIVTPFDDPCQYNPAWRSIVAGYLFAMGVRTKEDFRTLSSSGSVTVTRAIKLKDDSEAENDDQEPQDKTKGRKKAKKKEPKRERIEKVVRRIEPFFDHPEYRPMASDRWIVAQIGMMEEEVSGNPLSDACVPYRLAYRWYSEMECEAAMKKRLEALLLTEIGVDIITLDLIGFASVQPAIEAYEKLYFNCRDEEFNRLPSMQLIQRMAMPWGPLKMFCRKWEELDDEGFVIGDGRPIAKDSDVWRAVAATMGYETLMYMWGWDKVAHGIEDRSIQRMLELSWKAAIARLMKDLYSGEIAHEDAARVLSAYTSQSKQIADAKNGGVGIGSNDTTKALMAVLYQTSPHMITIDESEDSGRNDEIQSRIKSQMAINKQKIEDAGKQVERQVIDAQLIEAVNVRE